MKKATIAILLGVFLVGCSKTLTRGKAEDLIAEKYHYDQGVNFRVDPTQDEAAEGRQRGLWGHGLSEYGRRFFTIDQECMCIVTASKVHPVVEVTGITGDGSVRTVQYTVHWVEALPAEVRDIFKHHDPDRRSCTLRLYDDGWRAED